MLLPHGLSSCIERRLGPDDHQRDRTLFSNSGCGKKKTSKERGGGGGRTSCSRMGSLEELSKITYTRKYYKKTRKKKSGIKKKKKKV